MVVVGQLRKSPLTCLNICYDECKSHAQSLCSSGGCILLLYSFQSNITIMNLFQNYRPHFLELATELEKGRASLLQLRHWSHAASSRAGWS